MDGTLGDCWEQLRPTITRLYDHGFSYNRIRQYMRRKHGFVASDAGFKRHFREWGLRRNATEDGYCILAKIIQDLEIDGWRPDHRPYFRIRDRQLDYHSVVRSIKRRRIVAIPGDKFVQPTHIKLVYPQAAPFAPLVTPAVLALPEIALLKTQQIYKLTSIYNLAGADHLRRCQDFYGWALQAINQSQYKSAQEHLGAASDHLALAAKQGTLHLSPLFCYAIVQAQADRCERVRPYLDTFLVGALELIKLYYSEEHPFSITFGALRETSLREELSIRILELIIDQLSMSNIKDNRLSHVLSDEVEIILIDTFRQLGRLDKAISQCHCVIAHRAQFFPEFHTKKLAAQNTLANCCLSNTDWRGAENALQSVFDADRSPNGRWSRTFHYFEALRLETVALKFQSRVLEAGRLVDQAMLELWSPDLDIVHLEAILYGIIRMMDQNARYQEADWMRAQMPDITSKAQHGHGHSALRMERLVWEYFFSPSLRGVNQYL